MSPISKHEGKNIDDIINDELLNELINVEEFVIDKKGEEVAAVVNVDEIKRLQDLINTMNDIIRSISDKSIIDKRIDELISIKKYVVDIEGKRLAAFINISELKLLQDIINDMSNIIESKSGKNAIEEMKNDLNQ